MTPSYVILNPDVSPRCRDTRDEESGACEGLRSFVSLRMTRGALRMTFSSLEIGVFCGWVIRYLPKNRAGTNGVNEAAESVKGR